MPKFEMVKRIEKSIMFSRLNLTTSDPNNFFGYQMKDEIRLVLGRFIGMVNQRNIEDKEKILVLEESRNKLFLLMGQMAAKLCVNKSKVKPEDPSMYNETIRNIERMDTIIDFIKKEIE
jgi:hypothetical protein